MNRERILFVVVVAIFALWFFVMKEDPNVIANAKPGKLAIKLDPVLDATRVQRPVQMPETPPFTLVTNERPHPRPILPFPEARDLPNIWPPTSRSVSLTLLGRLRRDATPVGLEDKAVIQLPALDAGGGAADAGPIPERVDQWTSFNRLNKGLVTGVKVKGKVLRAQGPLPEPGPLAPFFRALVLAEVDPGRAQQEGVEGIEVKFEKGGTNVQAFPSELSNVKLAIAGKQKGWFVGARAYVRLPAKGSAKRVDAGRRLLTQARNMNNDAALLKWVLIILKEARDQLPSGNQGALRDILLLEMEAANILNVQEKVLALGFEHLSRFPREVSVLEYMGNILSSRSFSLHPLAEKFYARASTSRNAQRRRAGLLIEQGKFDEAGKLLDSGVAGGGTEVDLLRARVALALGDFDTAVAKAGGHANGTGAVAADAHQILGGVAYAKGEAARAETHFMNAVQADTKRSTAYSDLGLALAAQGKAADAELCFARAKDLDFENAIIPALGSMFLRSALADSASDADNEEVAAAKLKARGEALEGLKKLHEDNPRDLLVRYFLAYAKEKAGDPEGAAADLRTILDEDHRYRIAIARLGIVQSRRREAGGGDELVRPAIAQLTKSAELNPQDGTVAYILARFLMSQDLNRKEANRYFARCASLPAPARDPELPMWAAAAQAALKYRDDSEDELRVRSAFNKVIEDVKRDGTRKGQNPDRYVATHPVGRYATKCRAMVAENATKVDVTWHFRTQSRDWKITQKNPMRIVYERNKGLHFQGTVNYQGEEVDHNTRLKYSAVEYPDRRLTGNKFFELIVEGEIPEAAEGELGVGVLGVGSNRRRGRTGIQIVRRTNGVVAVRLEGGESDLFKKDKARNYIEFENVNWKPGKFTLHFKVEERDKGMCSITLNGENVFATKLKGKTGETMTSERVTIFGKGRGSRNVTLNAWIEGSDGARYRKIYITKVTLVKASN